MIDFLIILFLYVKKEKKSMSVVNPTCLIALAVLILPDEKVFRFKGL